MKTKGEVTFEVYLQNANMVFIRSYTQSKQLKAFFVKIVVHPETYPMKLSVQRQSAVEMKQVNKPVPPKPLKAYPLPDSSALL